jgi:predicted dehydrogenase
MVVAVVGLGSMGMNHVRVLRELVEVAEVLGVDVRPPARSELRRRYRLDTFATLEHVVEQKPDAAIVATPSTTHWPVAEELLAAGIPCLVEKPLASSPTEAEVFLKATGSVFATVGHVERFNPAIVELRRRVPDIGRVFAVASRRIGPYPTHVRDVGVCLDLLTHDVDAIRYVSGSDFESVDAVGGRFLGSAEDHVFATGQLVSGEVVSMEAGWLSPTKVRELRVVGEGGTLVADTLLQNLYLYENSVGAAEEEWEALATFRGIGEGNVIRFAIRREEPLRAEVRHFLACVRGEESPLVQISDGIEAVRLASSIAAKVGKRP